MRLFIENKYGVRQINVGTEIKPADVAKAMDILIYHAQFKGAKIPSDISLNRAYEEVSIALWNDEMCIKLASVDCVGNGMNDFINALENGCQSEAYMFKYSGIEHDEDIDDHELDKEIEED